MPSATYGCLSSVLYHVAVGTGELTISKFSNCLWNMPTRTKRLDFTHVFVVACAVDHHPYEQISLLLLFSCSHNVLKLSHGSDGSVV